MNNRRRTAGLTLIELMVTMLLATILIGGLFFMMSGQERTYKNQIRTLAAQENLWGAMEYLQAEVRKAGFGFSGCSGQMKSILDASVVAGGIDGMFTAMVVHNNHNLLCEQSKALGTPLCGPTGVPADGTDSLSLQYYQSDYDAGVGVGIKVTTKMPDSSANLVMSASGDIKRGDLIVICAPGSKWGTVLQASKDVDCKKKDNDGDGKADCALEHNSGGSFPWNPPGGHNIFPPGGYGAGATVVKIGGDPTEQFFNYAIDRSRNPPVLVRWQGTTATAIKDRQVIAEGIEDMQFSWTCDSGYPSTGPNAATVNDGEYGEGKCIDSNGDGVCCGAGDTCDERLTDEWANNSATGADNVPVCVDAAGEDLPIRMVRITLVGRTVSPMIGVRTGFRPAAEDHAQGTAAEDLIATGNVGTYNRATLTAKIKPRNIRGTE